MPPAEIPPRYPEMSLNFHPDTIMGSFVETSLLEHQVSPRVLVLGPLFQTDEGGKGHVFSFRSDVREVGHATKMRPDIMRPAVPAGKPRDGLGPVLTTTP